MEFCSSSTAVIPVQEKHLSLSAQKLNLTAPVMQPTLLEMEESAWQAVFPVGSWTEFFSTATLGRKGFASINAEKDSPRTQEHLSAHDEERRE